MSHSLMLLRSLKWCNETDVLSHGLSRVVLPSLSSHGRDRDCCFPTKSVFASAPLFLFLVSFFAQTVFFSRW